MTEGNWKVAEGAFRANLAHLMAKQGELDPAFDLLDEAEQLVREAHVETWMGVLALRAELALDIGRSGLAQQQVETLKTVFEEHGRPNDLLRLRKRMPSTLLELVERVFST